jgi:hypothetical protein
VTKRESVMRDGIIASDLLYQNLSALAIQNLKVILDQVLLNVSDLSYSLLDQAIKIKAEVKVSFMKAI